MPESAPGAGDNLTNRPILGRVLPDGTLDATFGSGGIATAEVLGPKPAFAEAYDIGRQRDGKLVLVGYGSRGGGPVDVVAYRFTARGRWDRSFGSGGATVYDRAGLEDRGRDLVVLPDDRVVIVGSTAPHAVAGTPQLNALLYMLRRNGTPDASFGANGAISVHLGGPSDALFGSTVLPGGRKVVAAGYRGASPNTGDEAALVRIDLSGHSWPGGPAGPGGAPGPAGHAGPASPAGPAGRPARISVRCRVTGGDRDRVACTVRRASSTPGTIRAYLRRAGRLVASGRARARGATPTLVRLRGTAKAGRRYALTVTLPAALGPRTKIKRRILLR